ncbi:MAG: M24 family metallopeptidase [Acidobacteriaceae bacterium]
MKEHDLEAIFVTGPGMHNPAMVYMMGGGHVTNADLIKKRGEEAVLFYEPMERDEAAKSGLTTKNMADYKLNDLIDQAAGDVTRAYVRLYQLIFADLGITSGRVALYGRTEIGGRYALLTGLQRDMPDLSFVGELDTPVLTLARMTKDESEIERIRKMGSITTQVVGMVADFVTSHAVKNELLVKKDGEPLTIGEVKSRINLWLAERGAENPEDTIFSIGRDAGVPHSSGNPGQTLRLGQAIIFDIYPCEAGGGYFYDFTRTWCLGYAPDEVMALYEQVQSTYTKIVSRLEPGSLFKEYQHMTCELFSAQGHPTVMQDPQTQNGYVHGLGHGIGLNVHERPTSWIKGDDTNRLVAGAVFTIEPGLYYPEKGMGVRLEDSYYMRPDGTVELLASYPMDLVLPVKSA